jgi:LemA protein
MARTYVSGLDLQRPDRPRDNHSKLSLTEPLTLLHLWPRGSRATSGALTAVAEFGYALEQGCEISSTVPASPRSPIMSSTLIVLAVIVVLVLWAVTVYNGLIAMRQRVNQAFADVDVQLKQRHDLVPNLVETVKGYAAHERGTLDEVVKARNAAVSAQGPAQQAAAENMLSGALRQLFALSESYPDLKASTNFQQLQAELSDLENKIAASRRFFNNAVQEYNTGIQRFPAALFAASFGFAQKDYFDLGDDRKAVTDAPQVKF